MAELRLSDISAVRAAMQTAKGTVQTLWTADSGEHDCAEEKVETDNKVVLTKGTYDKLGSVHCGVTGLGIVSVGGDVSQIDDGHGVLFTRNEVVVCRTGDEYVFVRFADL